MVRIHPVLLNFETMKQTIIIAVLSIVLFASCSVYRHDPNVRFTQRGTNYNKLRNLGCKENAGYVGF